MTTKFELTINPLTVVLLIGFVVCLVIIFRSCQYDPGAEIGRLKGEIEARDEQIKMKEQGLAEIKADRDRIEAEMNGAIDSANSVIANLEAKDEEQKNKIDGLKEEYMLLQEQAQRLDNLKEQVSAWKQRFDLAQKKLTEKDEIIFSLTQKYNKELELRKVTEIVLGDYKQQALVRNELISELERKLRHKNRWQTLERLAFLAIAGLLTYQTLT